MNRRLVLRSSPLLVVGFASLVSILPVDAQEAGIRPTPRSGGTEASLFGGRIDLGTLALPDGMTLQGTYDFDRFGWSVSTAGDLNADGYDDIAIGAPLGGDECVDLSTNDWIRDVHLDDFDGDLDIDMALVSTDTDSLILYFNDGTGEFSGKTEYLTGGPDPTAVQGIDLEGDGDIDLVTGDYGTYKLSTFVNDGNGVFTLGALVQSGAGPLCIESGDVDGDGDPDLMVLAFRSRQVTVHLNDGTGTFAPAAYTSVQDNPMWMTTGHFNADAYCDLAVSYNYELGVDVFLGVGNGSFSPGVNHATPDDVVGVDAGDVDGDGDLDLVTAHRDYVKNATVLLNDGTGQFAISAYLFGGDDERFRFVELADIDADADLDVVASSDNASLVVLRNDGTGGFGSFETYYLGAIPVGAGRDARLFEIAELDGLPGLDVAAAVASPGCVHLMYNDGTGGYPGTPDAGDVYVLFGGPGFDAHPTIDLGALDGTRGVLIEGEAPGDQLGYSVAGGGDVNGDGIDDLIIGAPYADPPDSPDAGKAYVVFGADGWGAGGTFDLGSLDGTNGFEMRGENGLDKYPLSDHAGWDVAFAGDFDADGFGDLLVGAPYGFNGEPAYDQSGYTYLVRGGPSVGGGGVFPLLLINGTNGVRIQGEGHREWGGFSVGGAGDVNADGFDDLLFTTPEDEGVSREAAHLVFGTTFPLPPVIDLENMGGVGLLSFTSEDGDDSIYGDVSGIGDLNGDGIDDLAVGLPNRGPDPERSRVAVVYGSPTLPTLDTLDLDSLDGTNGFRIGSYLVDAYLGAGVSGAGDFNHDGFPDVLCGAPDNYDDPSNPVNDLGLSYVVFGGHDVVASGLLDLTTMAETEGVVLVGAQGHDMSGREVHFVGDVNGDGLDDLVIGAPGTDETTPWPGDAYVIFGRKNVVQALGCGYNPEGSLTVIGGFPSIGTILQLGIDDPTGTIVRGTVPALWVSTHATDFYPCGRIAPAKGIGGVGEMLVDLHRDRALVWLQPGAPWTGPGSPVSIPVAIPHDPALIGRSLFAQATFLETVPSTGPGSLGRIRFGLTNGLEIWVQP